MCMGHCSRGRGERTSAWVQALMPWLDAPAQVNEQLLGACQCGPGTQVRLERVFRRSSHSHLSSMAGAPGGQVWDQRRAGAWSLPPAAAACWACAAAAVAAAAEAAALAAVQEGQQLLDPVRALPPAQGPWPAAAGMVAGLGSGPVWLPALAAAIAAEAAALAAAEARLVPHCHEAEWTPDWWLVGSPLRLPALRPPPGQRAPAAAWQT